MNGLLLALLMVQLIPSQSATGVVAGTVLSSNGAPAAGVRVVAIPAGDPNTLSNAATVFEGLAQTDSSGHYRLEAPAGRYYIAAGSVNSPTYFPDVISITSARVVSITAGAVTDGVNFSRYVPAPTSSAGLILPPALPPGSTGVLSGIIRTSDGNPALAVTVVLVPQSIVQPVTAGGFVNGALSPAVIAGIQLQQALLMGLQMSNTGLPNQRMSGGVIRTGTDNSGRYRFDNVSPDTYRIMAGFAESPTYFPGTADISMATPITTTPVTKLDNLDLRLPPAPKTTSLRGRVTANAGRPAGGAGVTLRSMDTLTGWAGLLPRRPYKDVLSGADGTFEFPDVVAGIYSVQARLAGATALSKDIVIGDQPRDVNFDFMINLVLGRIVWEDGAPFSDNRISEVALSTVSNPNLIATTIFTVSSGGFSYTMEAGEYRFFLWNLPDELTISSITAGKTDLIKDPLVLNGNEPVNIEVRVAKRSKTGVSVGGVIRDAATGRPPGTDLLYLCCLSTGPFDRLSTTLQADGSFEFHNVTPQRQYSVELRGRSAGSIVNADIAVGTESQFGLILNSAMQLAPVTANFEFKNVRVSTSGISLTMKSAVTDPLQSIAFTIPSQMPAIPAASVPVGVRYNVSVNNLPEGYKVESLTSGTVDLLVNPLDVRNTSTQIILVVIAPRD